MNRTRIAACSALAPALLLALAAPAHAHITVDPDEAEQGGYTTLNVKVPNERDDASTVEVTLHLDPDHPLTSAQPQAVPGWEVEVETAELDEPVESHGAQVTEAPSTITWSGGEIAPGTFQQFPLSVGPLPEDVDQLVLKAIQTYDNDEVVRWIEEPAEDGTEPEHPAALLQLAPASDGDGADAAAAAAASDADADSQAAGSSDGTDTTARVLGGLGVALGAAGVAYGVLAGRRRSTGSSDS